MRISSEAFLKRTPHKSMVLHLLLVLLVLAISCAKAETWDEFLSLADSMLYRSMFDSGLVYCEEARKATLAEDDYSIEGRIYTLLKTAELLRYKGEHIDARKLLDEALSLSHETFGETSLETCRTLSFLGLAEYRNGEFESAERHLRSALRILRQVENPPPEDLSLTNMRLGLLLWHRGLIHDARDYLQTACDQARLTPDPLLLAVCTNSLGLVIGASTKHDSAMICYQQAHSIYERIAPDHPDAVWPINNIGCTYSSMGRVSTAEKYFMDALIRWKNTLGENHNFVAVGYVNVAECQIDLGRYEDAMESVLRAKTIFEANRDRTYSDAVLHRLFRLAFAQGDFDLAERYHSEYRSLLNESYGDSAFQTTLPLLASTYLNNGKLEEAEHTIELWLEYKKDAGPSSISYDLQGLATAAEVKWRNGNFGLADRIYDSALTIADDKVFSGHPNVASLMESQARMFRALKEYIQAVSVDLRALRSRLTAFQDVIASLSERDALNYSAFLLQSFGYCLSDFFSMENQSAPITEEIANTALICKGRGSEAIFARYREICLLDELGALADSLRMAKTRVSRLYVQSESSQDERLLADQLKNALDDKLRYESKLLTQNAAYRDVVGLMDVSVSDIRQVLRFSPFRDLLLEFIRYNHFSSNDPDRGVNHYAIVVVGSGDELEIIDIGEAQPIDILVERYRGHMKVIADGDHLPTKSNRAEFEEISRKLYDKLVAPVESRLTDTEVIFISPDAGLNLIAFSSLIDGDGKYLVEKAAVHYLSTGRDLVRYNSTSESGRDMLGMGNPDFNADARARLQGSDSGTVAYVIDDDKPRARTVLSDCMSLAELSAESLPYTEREIREIAERFERTTSERALTYFGSAASEERLKGEANGKRILHLATHGYFLHEECRREVAYQPVGSSIGYVGENPLLLSGLLLAGANLHGTGAGETGTDDGILTAEEVTVMNLIGTEMVVLSACETGIGKVENGEGVYGLRRAFQMAGASTVVSALWPIPDKETAQMMSELYKPSNESIPDKMRRVQLSQIEYLRKAGLSDHPFMWAGFIAIGDWR